MSHKAYKLNFTYMKEGSLKQYTRTVLATNPFTAKRKAEEIVEKNSDVNCKFTGYEEVKQGRIWKVTMDGTAHLRNSEDKLVDREDMHKVLFVDAFDMYDAEQVAYRIWEKQVVEEGWNDISIFRTGALEYAKHPMTDKEVA